MQVCLHSYKQSCKYLNVINTFIFFFIDPSLPQSFSQINPTPQINSLICIWLTNFNPLSALLQLLVCTFRKQWVWVVSVLVCHMSNKWFPFGKNQLLKTFFGSCWAPVNMVLYCSYPLCNSLTAFLFACCQHFFHYTFCNMPLVKIVGNSWVTLS